MKKAIIFKSGGVHHSVDGTLIDYVIANDKTCSLVQIDAKPIEYPYGITTFLRKNPDTGLLKVHKSYLLRLGAVIDYHYKTAILPHNIKIPLNTESYRLVKLYVDQKNLSAPDTTVS